MRGGLPLRFLDGGNALAEFFDDSLEHPLADTRRPGEVLLDGPIVGGYELPLAQPGFLLPVARREDDGKEEQPLLALLDQTRPDFQVPDVLRIEKGLAHKKHRNVRSPNLGHDGPMPVAADGDLEVCPEPRTVTLEGLEMVEQRTLIEIGAIAVAVAHEDLRRHMLPFRWDATPIEAVNFSRNVA